MSQITSVTTNMFTATFLYELLAVLLAGSIFVVLYFQHAFKYWEKRKVSFIKPVFPSGNTNFLTRGISVGIVTADFYKEFKRRGCRFGGIYTGPQPALVLVDLELIKNIMSKVGSTQFSSFTNIMLLSRCIYNSIVISSYTIIGLR